MSVNFTLRNVNLDDDWQALAVKQLKNLEKVLGEIIGGEVVVSEEKHNHRVEISLKTRNSGFHAEGRDPKAEQALRNALQVLKTQAKRNKEKTKEEKKRVRGKSWLQKLVPSGAEKVAIKAENDAVEISDSFSKKPMTVEEAVFFLREKGENAFMFVNSESGRMATLFINREGGLSLVEPNL